jgi:hypothetical protein
VSHVPIDQVMLRRWVKECIARAEALQDSKTHADLQQQGGAQPPPPEQPEGFDANHQVPPAW